MRQHRFIQCSLGLALVAALMPAQAANWLMLQGTEPQGAAERANVWGFIQFGYQQDNSDANTAGQYTPPKLLAPDLDSQSGFNLNRARLGVRGANFPLDGKTNYFLLAELGNNGITHGQDAFAKLVDASITLNHIPGARVRAGLFKYPGAEEGLQAVQVLDYINYTEVTNGLLLERFPNRAYTANIAAKTEAQLQQGDSLNGFTEPVGAFRDSGVQVFDAFDIGKDWELSYAAMLGNGSGIEFSDADNEQDTYLYLSAEKKYGGKGARAEGLKFFTWGQWGKRLLDNTNDATANLVKYSRDRAGLGFKYLRAPFRVSAEYITADGMIFVGPDKPSFTFATTNGADATAKGWYLEGGWRIPKTPWELDLRFDTLTRLEGRADEHQFDKWTLGVQYHFNPKTRLTLNYEMRDFECTGSVGAPCTTVNGNLDGVGDRIAVQLTSVF